MVHWQFQNIQAKGKVKILNSLIMLINIKIKPKNKNQNDKLKNRMDKAYG